VIRRVVVRTALTALIAIALAAAPTAAVAKKRATPTTTTTWPPLPSSSTTVSWSDCGPGFECGTLSVPVDWRAPTGEQLPLALVRHRAEGPDPRIGSLVVNYGGPGQGGVDYLPRVWTRIPAPVRARFDLVSWDPRGTGASRPVDCVDDATLDESIDLPAVPDSVASLAEVRAFNDTFAAGCAARTGAYAGQVGTRNTARDLEAIRRALGDAKLTYLGYSYGTVVGATYAQMYPSTVRAMVLDGPADWWAPRLDYAYAQAQGFQSALHTFLASCGPTCQPMLDALIARVASDPLPASYVRNGVTRAGVLTSTALEVGVLAALYDVRAWPTLTNGLRSAAVDGWGGPLLAAADQYLQRSADGTYSSTVEANAVINCVDHPEPTAPTPAQELADVTRFQASLPPWGGNWAVAGCPGMPLPAKGDKLGDVQVKGAPPILIVATTGDPATPYAAAQSYLTRIAGSSLLTFDGTEHTAYGSDRSVCIDDDVDSYLVDLIIPPAGTRC
jgi:pimeloyl-ACP methyl ester carboxylesterase